MTPRSEQLRHEAEQNRAQLAASLEELRARITPGEVVDQLIDHAAQSGAGDFFRNLGQQAVNNPVPILLMSAGLAWLVLSGTRSASLNGQGVAVGSATDRLGRWGTAAGETASELKDSAVQIISSSAEHVRSATPDLAKETGERMSRRPPENFPSEAGDEAASSIAAAMSTSGQAGSAARAGRGLVDFCTEHPLILAGVGLALGAALGAMLPSSRTENEFVGETRQRIDRGSQGLADERYDIALTGAERADPYTAQQGLPHGSELPQTAEENLPTAPILREEAAAGAVEPGREPWHGSR